MSKFAVLISVSVLVASCASKPTSTSAVPQANTLESIRTQYEMPGLATRVYEGSQKQFGSDLGVRSMASPEAVQATDQWHMGSCTKQMTAFAIAQLVDEKKLRFETKLSEIFPKKKLSKKIGAITVEQLLSFQSGLADVMDPAVKEVWLSLFNEGDVREQRDRLANQILKAPQHFETGSKAEYSNSAYVILGSIIEQRDKIGWEDAIQNRVFKKLGLNSCGFGPPGAADVINANSGQLPPATQPWGHSLKNGKLEPMPPNEIDADNPAALGPAGTIHCSLDDVAKFYQEVLRETRGTSTALSGATQAKLVSVSSHAPFTYNGMGRLPKSWAGGDVLSMNGSNSLNFMSVVLVPNQNRIYLSATNSATEKAESGIFGAMLFLIKQAKPPTPQQ